MLNKNTLTAICSAVLLSFTSVNATAMEGKMTTEPSPIVNSKLSLETKWDKVFPQSEKVLHEKIVFTNGCFDILHVGHVSYLEQAARLGRHLIVGLNTDASVKRLKGATRPLNHELDRARVLAALACVDAGVLFGEDTPTELVKKIRPDILVKGGDYKPEEVAGREYAGEVQIIKFEDGYSTTGLLEKVAQLVKEGKL